MQFRIDIVPSFLRRRKAALLLRSYGVGVERFRRLDICHDDGSKIATVVQDGDRVYIETDADVRPAAEVLDPLID